MTGDEGQGHAQERTAAVVLAYHPPAEIRENVARLLSEVPRVFLVNNSPDDASTALLDDIAADERVRVLPQQSNVGVAAGFNAGMRAALDDGFDFVWIFDQDSTVTPGMLGVLLDAHRAQGASAGVVGPALRSAETGRIYAAETGTGVAARDVLISSGSLFSRVLLERIGLHDAALFIDYVDHDINLRARRAGFTNLKVFGAILDHRFGDSQPTRFLWRRVYLSNYSPLRQYYMARNRLIVFRRFGGGTWLREDLVFSAKAWVKLVFLERDRPRKFRAFLRGVRDGLRYSAV